MCRVNALEATIHAHTPMTLLVLRCKQRGEQLSPLSLSSPVPVPVLYPVLYPVIVIVIVPIHPRPRLSSSFHPPSIPRAVARETGGEWCVVRRVRFASLSRHCPSPVAPVLVSFLVIPSHHTTLQAGACSGGGRWRGRGS
jgi:hypothetical protein